MSGAMLFAATLACVGGGIMPLGSTYIAIQPPAPGQRGCIYQRETGGSWATYMITYDYRLDEPLCRQVDPSLEFGRMDVPDGAYCPPDPDSLEPVAKRRKP